MPTYEELLEIIAKQQELIKKLTAELEKANQRIAELENEVARLRTCSHRRLSSKWR